VREALPTPAASVLKRFLPKPAVLAVADVETNQLVASTTGPQILGRTRQSGRARGQGKDRRYRLHLLSRLAVEVDLAGFGVGEGLTAGGRGAHPVELLRVHGREDY